MKWTETEQIPEPEPEVIREQAESSRILDASLPVASEMLQGLHKIQGPFAKKLACQLQNLFELLIVFISVAKAGKLVMWATLIHR